jgi:hypothetical protein
MVRDGRKRAFRLWTLQESAMIQAPFSGEISFWNQDVEYPIFLLPEVKASSRCYFHVPCASRTSVEENKKKEVAVHDKKIQPELKHTRKFTTTME